MTGQAAGAPGVAGVGAATGGGGVGGVVADERADRFLWVLGDELRTVRESWGWSRGDLRARLGFDLSLGTIGGWERGKRQCSALRVWQLCEGMEISIADLLARVVARMTDQERGAVTIDLVATIGSRAPGLVPLQAWARAQRDTDPTESRRTALLGVAAQEQMALLCEVPVVEFTARLRRAGLVYRSQPASPTPDEATSADHAPGGRPAKYEGI